LKEKEYYRTRKRIEEINEVYEFYNSRLNEHCNTLSNFSGEIEIVVIKITFYINFEFIAICLKLKLLIKNILTSSSSFRLSKISSHLTKVSSFSSCGKLSGKNLLTW
jgi:hypothetical protein